MVAEEIVFRGALLPEAGKRPVLVERRDQDLVGKLLEDLASPQNQDLLRSSSPKTLGDDKLLRLRIPLHRVFNFAVLELACDRPGYPRLAAEKIESAGLVVRRVGVNGGLESWLRSQRNLKGWMPTPGDGTLDPDPKRRRAVSSGNAEIDRRLAALGNAVGPMEEDVSPMFPAPPDVCAASGRTLLLGMLNLASSDQSETPIDFQAFKEEDVTALLPPHLKSGLAGQIPRPEQLLTPSFAALPDMAAFIGVLQQVAVEFALFANTPTSQALFAEVNKIVLEDGRGAAAFLQEATRTLLEREPDSTVRMPKRWPVLTTGQAQQIRILAGTVLAAQLKRLAGNEGRFDDLRRVYQARAFVRIKRPDGCAPTLYWSDYTEPFTIAAWYDPGDAPPALITLPDLSDRDQLKKLSPNVAFSMPEKLFNLLPTDLSGLVDGNKPPDGPSIGLGWICSFSIPIITFCAFLVLNIFLKLFDIIFQWMLFIKICIPIPVPRKK